MRNHHSRIREVKGVDGEFPPISAMETPRHESNDNHPLFIAMCPSGRDGYKTHRVTWYAVTELCGRHEVRAEKDGFAIIFAELREFRTDDSARSVTALAYEIDGKLTIDQVNARVAATGREALVWTTHNHLRTSQPIRVSTFSKWQQRTFGSTRAPTNEDVARFCHENKRYGHLKGVRLKNGGKVCQVREYGQKVEVFDIAHDPEHETRIVFPLKTPFDLRTGGISKARYKDHYHAFGREVFGGAYSPESANPARLHYGPSMPVEGTGIVRRHEGTLLVPEDIDISKVVAADKPNNPRRASLKLQAVGLDELQFLLEHIPPDLEYPDWFRAIAAIFHEARGSDEGNQLAHEWSNGDPRYDFDQVEGIWDSLTPDHERPATIGTLRKLAGEHDPSSMSKYHGLKSMKLFAVYMEVNHEH